MDSILAFAVLTGPLWLILIIVAVAIWIAIKVSKDYQHRGLAGVGIFLLVFALPLGDEIAGRVYLAGLCATKAGYEVFGTIELPAEYWDERGEPKFINHKGYIDQFFHHKYIDENDHEDERYSIIFPIDKSVYRTKEKASQKKLAQVTTYRFWGGWIRRNLSPHNSANSCDVMDAKRFTNNVYRKIFVMKNES